MGTSRHRCLASVHQSVVMLTYLQQEISLLLDSARARSGRVLLLPSLLGKSCPDTCDCPIHAGTAAVVVPARCPSLRSRLHVLWIGVMCRIGYEDANGPSREISQQTDQYVAQWIYIDVRLRTEQVWTKIS